MKGEYKAGLRNGVFLYYSPTGYYESAGQYKDDNLIGKWQYFHKNGRLKSEIMFEDRGYFLRSWDEKGNPLVVNGNGRDLTFYDNGKIKESMPYVNGIRNGESFGYHENGEVFFRERYDNGLMVYGVAIHQGQKYEYDQSVFSPHPVVGYKNLFKYLERKLKVPDAARENYIFGDLKMMFFVYQDGSIGDFKFINRLGYGCEEEAIRLITEGPEWLPVREHGVIPVTSQARIIVKFPYSEK